MSFPAWLDSGVVPTTANYTKCTTIIRVAVQDVKRIVNMIVRPVVVRNILGILVMMQKEKSHGSSVPSALDSFSIKNVLIVI